MRIAHVVMAAAAMAGLGQFFWGPRRARAGLASEARPGGGSLTGTGAAASTGRPFIGGLGVLGPAGSPRELARVGLWAAAGPAVLRCGSRSAKHTHC
jgi:hypothetical protein